MYFQDLLNIVMPLTIPHCLLQAYMDKTSIVKLPASCQSPDLILDTNQLEAFMMTLLETACLDFCIELLNQKTKIYKYKSLLAAAAKQGLWVGKAADQELAWLFNDKGLKVHYNTMHHNIFIKDSLVVFVTAYYKGFYASNNVKIIYQYLPCEVGKLVVYCQFLCILSIFLNNIQAKYKQVMAALEADKDLNKIGFPDLLLVNIDSASPVVAIMPTAPGGCIIMGFIQQYIQQASNSQVDAISYKLGSRRVLDAKFKRVQAYMEVVEGVGCHYWIGRYQQQNTISI
ncbi:predicted protein [Aspergillus nidulans FGSC A4]|uniref:Uncharacterized protein n=1 Tax=Emericella nidulans (strain FGSC A4 / ATCC 38163 / CBS 112.46 / NRRL 194 / M139) TaxID=227321 RepID=Q5AQC3_EMENI|nr:hypothetical protein [Aspergillus nidulans FGSC A4]EAA66757.1 predicted protein [Aspergillus nidulans FGSC A4]CBF82251.1 TPA: hypothetical protein ANIA_09507 [Aspergillus nidulans FGSC A4]|eukprot:XP_868889.1 predicted protein [Aspergillus nidulans FGSC A4]